MQRSKELLAALMLILVGILGCIPLLIASCLTGRDYQLEQANTIVELVYKKSKSKPLE